MPEALDITFTIIGLVASIASLVLAVIAIWLAIAFYRMADDRSREASNASAQVKESVAELNRVFDLMHKDTFGMMKNMQEQIFKVVDPSRTRERSAASQDLPEASESDSKTIGGNRSNRDSEASSEGATPENKDMRVAAADSEVQDAIIDALVMSYITETRTGLTMREIQGRTGVNDDNTMIANLFDLRLQGRIKWSNEEANTLSTSDLISLTASERKRMMATLPPGRFNHPDFDDKSGSLV